VAGPLSSTDTLTDTTVRLRYIAYYIFTKIKQSPQSYKSLPLRVTGYLCQVFLRYFRNPIRVPRIENWVPRVRENQDPRIREYRVPRIRKIGFLQVHTGYLTFSLIKTLFMRVWDDYIPTNFCALCVETARKENFRLSVVIYIQQSIVTGCFGRCTLSTTKVVSGQFANTAGVITSRMPNHFRLVFDVLVRNIVFR